MIYLAFIVQIVHACAQKQSAVRPHDPRKAGKKKSLHSLWSVVGIPYALCPFPTFRTDSTWFLLILFLKN